MTAAESTRKVAARKAKADLHARLLAAQKAVKSVAKRGVNQAQGYNFVQAEDVTRTANEALHAQGLTADFETHEVHSHDITSGKGTPGLVVTVYGMLHVTADGEEQVERSAVGSGSDYPGDKATMKAMTAARKYALIHLLAIPTGDDPEEDVVEPAGNKAPEGKPQGKPLDEEVVGHLGKAILALGVGLDWLKLRFGAVGAEAPKNRSKASLAKALRALTPEQAEALGVVLEAEGDSDGS